MKTVVLYPGRFQPMLPHHAEVYRHLQSQFPDAEVYITTSNKVEADKSPFNAEEKISIMTKQHDIPEDRIIITKSPYNWKEYEKSFDSANTKLIFAVGGKDMEGDPRFSFKPKKDGSPSYLQMINTNSDNALPMNQSGYVYSAPTIGDANEAASASAFRTALLSAPALESAKETYTRFMGEFNQEIFDLVYDKITGNIMKESIEILKKLAGLLDEAPINFKPGKGALDYEPGISQKDQKASAERPAKAAASDPNTVEFTKIAPEDMISVDTGKPINSRQRARSMANQFPDGADVNDPAVKKEMFLKLLAQSPGYVLGEINARLAVDAEGLAVSDRLSGIVDDLPENGIMGLNDDDRKWTLLLVNNAMNNMELHRKDASLDKFDDLESDEDELEIDPDGPSLGYVDDEEEDELEMEEDLNDMRKRAGLEEKEWGTEDQQLYKIGMNLKLQTKLGNGIVGDFANGVLICPNGEKVKVTGNYEEDMQMCKMSTNLNLKIKENACPCCNGGKGACSHGKDPCGTCGGTGNVTEGKFKELDIERQELEIKRQAQKKPTKKKMPKDLSGKSTKLKDFGKNLFKFDEGEYSEGDMVIIRGKPYILDKQENDIWWASDKDGAEIEFHPGSEDHHEPKESVTEKPNFNELRQLAGLQEGGECYHCDGEDENCEYCQGTGYVTGEDDPNEPSQEEIDANYEIYKKHAEKGSQEENLDLSNVVESIVGEQRIDELNFGKIKNVIMQKIASKFGASGDEWKHLDKRLVTSYKKTDKGVDQYITVDGEQKYGPFKNIEEYAKAINVLSNSLIMNKNKTPDSTYSIAKPGEVSQDELENDPSWNKSVQDYKSAMGKADIDAMPVAKESAPYEPLISEMDYEELLGLLGVTREEALMDLQDYYAPEQVHKDNVEEYEDKYREDVLEPAAEEISSGHAEPAEPEDEYQEETIELDEFQPDNAKFPPDQEPEWIVIDKDGKEVPGGTMLKGTLEPTFIIMAIPPTNDSLAKIQTNRSLISIPNDWEYDIKRNKPNEPKQGNLPLPEPDPHQPELPNLATPQPEREVQEDGDLKELKKRAGL